ncbi:hemicentin-1-like isoform X1 [Lates japonicus]|uniref:Hemicentin-1-like isoform X1 n=1 Tax=Lates japonicus TaxID=270547 RepID=A0AAD3MSJ6_LATJO|nr:hemicentin-1-like isoform X1 [Lates japonicus]
MLFPLLALTAEDDRDSGPQFNMMDYGTGLLLLTLLLAVASVTVQPGQRLTITCQVSYSVSSYYTAWIRQPAGKELEWIGHAAGSSAYYKRFTKNRTSISTDSSSNTMTTLNGQMLQPEDTAVLPVPETL